MTINISQNIFFFLHWSRPKEGKNDPSITFHWCLKLCGSSIIKICLNPETYSLWVTIKCLINILGISYKVFCAIGNSWDGIGQKTGFIIYEELDTKHLYTNFLTVRFGDSGGSSSWMAYSPSSLKTGTVSKYCNIFRSLSNGHSTCFHVMNSLTCLASSQNF